VEQTAFASEAIDLAEAMQPEVVVLDLSLDGESGLDAIPHLRSVAPDARIVVYSGAETLKGPARRAGADAVLDKVSMSSVDELERVVTGVASAP
jgi:DNA-binding NarL/FixJ family response regulator